MRRDGGRKTLVPQAVSTRWDFVSDVVFYDFPSSTARQLLDMMT